MAIGIETPVGGGIIFGAVKFIGYTAYAYSLKKLLNSPETNIYVFGFVRVLIGLIIGYAYFNLFQLIYTEGNVDVLYYLCLLPLRLAEWYLIIWWFFGKGILNPKQIINYAVLGTVLSCVLDIPAAFVFIQVSRFWIC